MEGKERERGSTSLTERQQNLAPSALLVLCYLLGTERQPERFVIGAASATPAGVGVAGDDGRGGGGGIGAGGRACGRGRGTVAARA